MYDWDPNCLHDMIYI